MISEFEKPIKRRTAHSARNIPTQGTNNEERKRDRERKKKSEMKRETKKNAGGRREKERSY